MRSKARNKMSPQRMEDYVYVRHNLLQVERVRELAQCGKSTIAWTEGSYDEDADEEDAWEDAWHDAREDAQFDYAASQEERVTRSKNRGKAMRQQASQHIRPCAVSSEESRLAKAASDAKASRSGRTIRRPDMLDL